jgi:tetratricopeptide (TPR) repeat protein
VSWADVYRFKDGEERTARLREYDPPIMRLEYADETGTDFPITTHIAFDYDVASTEHPQKFVSQYYKEANIWFEKGNNALYAKDYRNAIVAYDQALAMNPEHIPAQMNKGAALLALSSFDEAFAVYRALRRQEPNMGEPAAYMAYVYYRKELFADARAACDEALRFPDVQADRDLSAALTRMRRSADALSFPR